MVDFRATATSTRPGKAFFEGRMHLIGFYRGSGGTIVRRFQGVPEHHERILSPAIVDRFLIKGKVPNQIIDNGEVFLFAGLKLALIVVVTDEIGCTDDKSVDLRLRK
jgi:hypothetical protein